MEELALLLIIAAIFLGEVIVLFLADLFGLAMGLGWRHYSNRRAAQKAEKMRLRKNST